MVGLRDKPDMHAVSKSPAVDIMKLLEADGGDVVYHDPFVPRVSEDWESAEMTDALLADADAVVIVPDHWVFDYERIVRLSLILVDTRNATAGVRGVDRSRHPEGWIVKNSTVLEGLVRQLRPAAV